MNRRSLLAGGLTTLFAAPAIVRASSLMAISPVTPVTGIEILARNAEILARDGAGPAFLEWQVIAHYNAETGVVTLPFEEMECKLTKSA